MTTPASNVQASHIDDLLKAVATRDILAFRALYDLTLARLSAVSRAITRDAALADDVLQLTYFKIWERAAQFDPARGPSIGWILRICRNTAIDELRKQRLVRAREIGEGDGHDLAAFAADERLVDQRLVDDARPGDWLRHLPPEQADALVYVYEQGLTHAELAAKLKLPLGTVKSRVRRALIAVRELAR